MLLRGHLLAKLDHGLLNLACRFVFLFTDTNYGSVVAQNLIFKACGNARRLFLFLLLKLVKDGHFEKGLACGPLYLSEVLLCKV